MAEIMTFFGYIIILVLDKVLIDTHTLFDKHDLLHQSDSDVMKLETDIN